MDAWRRGVITTWHDDRLFGFITPEDGGEEVFFHISGWTQRRSCPVEGFTVAYTLAVDPEHGLHAAGVHLREGRFPPSPLPRRNWLGLIASICFALISLGAVSVAAYGGLLPPVVPVTYAVASLVAVIAYGVDKGKAQTGSWRMAESRLHFLELIGGWPGALVGQHLFRHKTRKASYQLEFWCIVVLNAALLGWLALRDGQWRHISFGDQVRNERLSPAKPTAGGDPPSKPVTGSKTITINESDFKTGRNWNK